MTTDRNHVARVVTFDWAVQTVGELAAELQEQPTYDNEQITAEIVALAQAAENAMLKLAEALGVRDYETSTMFAANANKFDRAVDFEIKELEEA